MSYTSNSSLSFEAVEIKFTYRTPHNNTKKVTKGIFEILSRSRGMGFFQALARLV